MTVKERKEKIKELFTEQYYNAFSLCIDSGVYSMSLFNECDIKEMVDLYWNDGIKTIDLRSKELSGGSKTFTLLNDAKFNVLNLKLKSSIDTFNEKVLSSAIVFPKEDISKAYVKIKNKARCFRHKSGTYLYDIDTYETEIVRFDFIKDKGYSFDSHSKLVDGVDFDYKERVDGFYTYLQKYNITKLWKLTILNKWKEDFFIYIRDGKLYCNEALTITDNRLCYGGEEIRNFYIIDPNDYVETSRYFNNNNNMSKEYKELYDFVTRKLRADKIKKLNDYGKEDSIDAGVSVEV